MRAFFTPFGIYPNNAIVGGSGSIAPGAALYKLVNKKPGVVVCNIGDGALGCGPVWEGMNFSSMDQVRTLWGEDGGGLPIIFNVWNNTYGMGGQTWGETMGYGSPVRVGAALRPNQLYAERVDGYNPLAVMDVYGRKKDLAKKDGPVLLQIVTYRISGHSPSDSSSYRSKEEIAAWEAEDSIEAYGKELMEAGLCTQADLDAIQSTVKADMLRNMKLAIDDAVSPRVDIFGKTPNAIGDLMFSNGHIRSMDESRKAETLVPFAESPRTVALSKKVRQGLDESGKPVRLSKGLSGSGRNRRAYFEEIL